MKIQSKIVLQYHIILKFVMSYLQARYSKKKKSPFSKLKEFQILKKKVRVLP